MAEFRMPALGADMAAGTLVAYRCKPGDVFRRGDIIAEVETDKGVIEIEAYAPGVLERWLVELGQKVPVGTPLALLRDEGAPSVAPQQAPAASTRAVPRATPAARRHAQELGVDLGAVQGSRGGVITLEDVERAAAQTTAPP
ncbi:MAG: biotin/lipoyl-containing protein, partial [Polyangiales bacterium]